MTQHSRFLVLLGIIAIICGSVHSKLYGSEGSASLNQAADSCIIKIIVDGGEARKITVRVDQPFGEIAEIIANSSQGEYTARHVSFTGRSILIGDYDLAKSPQDYAVPTSSEDPSGDFVTAIIGYVIQVEVQEKKVLVQTPTLNISLRDLSVLLVKAAKDVNVEIQGIPELMINGRFIGPKYLLSSFKEDLKLEKRTINSGVSVDEKLTLRIHDNSGYHTPMTVLSTDLLGDVLERLSEFFPDANLLEKNELCIDPRCLRLLAGVDKPMSSFKLARTSDIYFPGDLILKIDGVGAFKFSLSLSRTSSVSLLLQNIQDRVGADFGEFKISGTDDEGKLIEQVFYSSKITEYSNTIIADLDVHFFKLESLREMCNVKIEYIITDEKKIFNAKKDCRITYGQLTNEFASSFSKVFPEGFYSSNEELQKNLPGRLLFKKFPENRSMEELNEISIKEFGRGDLNVEFTFKVYVTVRFEYFDSVTKSTLAKYSIYDTSTTPKKIASDARAILSKEFGCSEEATIWPVPPASGFLNSRLSDFEANDLSLTSLYNGAYYPGAYFKMSKQKPAYLSIGGSVFVEGSYLSIFPEQVTVEEMKIIILQNIANKYPDYNITVKEFEYTDWEYAKRPIYSHLQWYQVEEKDDRIRCNVEMAPKNSASMKRLFLSDH